MTNRECMAMVIGVEFHCDKCGYVWDINDDEPPECGPTEVDHVERIKKKLDGNNYRLILNAGAVEIPFRARWMAVSAYGNAVEAYMNGSYDHEPVLIGPDGEEVKV